MEQKIVEFLNKKTNLTDADKGDLYAMIWKMVDSSFDQGHKVGMDEAEENHSDALDELF